MGRANAVFNLRQPRQRKAPGHAGTGLILTQILEQSRMARGCGGWVGSGHQITFMFA